MAPRRVGAVNAVLFFLFWLVVLLAGADFPPPPGFRWILVAIAAYSAVVYWRVPMYVEWMLSGRPGRYAQVVLDGFVAGLLTALPFALRGSGKPSVSMGPLDYAIWFAVLAAVGILNSIALYGLNALMLRFSSRTTKM
jgi:hypothetical protein